MRGTPLPFEAPLAIVRAFLGAGGRAPSLSGLTELDMPSHAPLLLMLRWGRCRLPVSACRESLCYACLAILLQNWSPIEITSQRPLLIGT